MGVFVENIRHFVISRDAEDFVSAKLYLKNIVTDVRYRNLIESVCNKHYGYYGMKEIKDVMDNISYIEYFGYVFNKIEEKIWDKFQLNKPETMSGGALYCALKKFIEIYFLNISHKFFLIKIKETYPKMSSCKLYLLVSLKKSNVDLYADSYEDARDALIKRGVSVSQFSENAYENLKISLKMLPEPEKKTKEIECHSRIKEQIERYSNTILSPKDNLDEMIISARSKGLTFKDTANFIKEKNGITYSAEAVRKREIRLFKKASVVAEKTA